MDFESEKYREDLPGSTPFDCVVYLLLFIFPRRAIKNYVFKCTQFLKQLNFTNNLITPKHIKNTPCFNLRTCAQRFLPVFVFSWMEIGVLRKLASSRQGCASPPLPSPRLPIKCAYQENCKIKQHRKEAVLKSFHFNG